MMYPSAVERERYADLAVHAISLIGVVAGAALLMVNAVMSLNWAVIVACAIYCLTMLASFGISAGYHLLPWHYWRPAWRRAEKTQSSRSPSASIQAATSRRRW